jgi:mannose-1-phosphate guanylyltransferase
MSKITNVILTGGVGSRLWPLSRKSNPKQYLEIFEDKSLFERTILRNKAITNSVLVVGNKDNYAKSISVLQKIGVEAQHVIESTPRNTAAAIAFAAIHSNPEDILLISPSDHIIERENEYVDSVTKAIALAKQDYIVTFGIVPTKPETGYGYIEYQNDDVVAFREKPDAKTAEEFLAKGNFLWNSGMFCFKAKILLEELQQFNPEVLATARTAMAAAENGFLGEELSLLIPSISIDYAVMEQSKKMKVVPASFQWSDLGTFESVYDYLVSKGHPTDAQGNMVIGTEVATEFLGLQDVIFVHTKDANLILKKTESQAVKDIYSRLETNKSDLIT